MPSPFPLPATPENIARARAFVFQKWAEREAERFPERGAPADLSGSCKFSSMFAQAVFGGELRANPEHQFLRLDGQIIDLNADAGDVRALANPYSHWRSFFRKRDYQDILRSCRPRVDAWVAEFASLLVDA